MNLTDLANRKKGVSVTAAGRREWDMDDKDALVVDTDGKEYVGGEATRKSGRDRGTTCDSRSYPKDPDRGNRQRFGHNQVSDKLR